MVRNLLRLLRGDGASGKRRIQGALDGRIDAVWQGWALDGAMPGRMLTVTVVTATGRRFEVRADRYRADVHGSMPGHGYYGFRVPDELLGGDELAEVLVEGVALPSSRAGKGPR